MAGTATDELPKTPDLGYKLSSSSPPEPTTTNKYSNIYQDRELEDGPLFRATLTQLENRTGALKANVKRLLKSTSQSLEAKQEWLKADINFVESLREMPSLDPLSTHYLDQAWKELLDQRERLTFSMQSLLISPLQKIYDLDIKTADIKRRQFEDESKEYYATLSKYLSLKTTSTTPTTLPTYIDTNYNNGISNSMTNHPTNSATPTTYAKKKEQRKSIELEAKHSAKQRHFDLVRFDYYNFLMDLNGGKKEQEVLFHLLTYQQREYDFYQSVAKNLAKWKPGLDELASLMAQASSEQCLVNKERQEKRRQLESKCMNSDTNNDMETLQQQQQQQQQQHGTVNEARSSTSSSREPPKGQQQQQQQQQQPALPTSPRSQMSFMDAVSMTSSSSASCLSPGGYRSSMDPSTYSSSSNARTSGDGGGGGGGGNMDDSDQDDGDDDMDQVVNRRKEGFLFSPARPTKSNPATGSIWHKHWSVVSGGQLFEYSNWKKHLETHHEPINLRFATVREARNSDRRFCFEVITPQYSRVYQATSQDDMHSWIQSICNAIESALNGESPSMVNLPLDNSTSTSTVPIPIVRSTHTGVVMDDHDDDDDSVSGNNNKALLDRATNNGDGNRRKSWKDHGRSLTVALNGLRRKKNNGNNNNTTHHDKDGLSSPPPPPPAANRQSMDGLASTTKGVQGNLLSVLRKNPSNCYCADCGVKNPEWCSLNLGVVICIDCGGIHRSLGTHITKVRSLTLDTTSFTADAVAMLKNLGNDTANAILEAVLHQEGKLTPKDSSAAKQAFIRDKYDLHRFVQLSSDANTNTNDVSLLLLFDALDKDDIPQALNALILGADPNGQRPTLTASSLNTEQVFLPVLDINGNLVHDRTTSIAIPIQKQQQKQHHGTTTTTIKEATTDQVATAAEAMKTARYALHFALQHPRKLGPDDDDLEAPVVFPMAELLIQNGARLDIVDTATGYEISTLLSFGDILTDQALAYLNIKNQARGRSPIYRVPLPSLPASPPRLPTLSEPM